MKGAIMQPYFFPYIGYYHLAYEVDKFIFLDDANYIKKGYINRNSIVINGASHEFSVPVSKISQNRKINQHEYTGEFSGFLKTIEQSYKAASCFNAAMPVIEKIVLDQDNNVARKNAKSVKMVFEYLGIEREFFCASAISLDSELKGQDRIVALCKETGIDKYRNAIGGQSLYNREIFNASGVDLRFIKSDIRPYPQRSDEFVSHLSIIDMLMNCDKSTIKKHLSCYSLV